MKQNNKEASNSVLYYVSENGTQQGPYIETALHAQVSAGLLPAHVMVWAEGMPEWKAYNLVFSQKEETAEATVQKTAPSGSARKAAMKAVTKVNSLVGDISGLETLEGFSWKKFFSAVFRKHSDEEVHEIFNCGSKHNTPSLDQISPTWPTPWLFTRMLVYGIVLACLFWWGEEKMGNILLFPGFIIFSAMAVPFAVSVLFFELNIRRDISLYNFQRCLIGGGAAAIAYTVIMHAFFEENGIKLVDAWWAGPIEEAAKLYAALLVIKFFKIKNIRILTGVLIGCAVGAGFAIFETAGCIFSESIPNIFLLGAGNVFADAPEELKNAIIYYIQNALGEDWDPGSFQSTAILRGILAPLCHVVWTAVVVGAFFRVSNMREENNAQKLEWKNIDWMTVADARFLKVAIFPVVLHMIWNSPEVFNKIFGESTPILYLLVIWPLLGLIAWILALRMVQAGINQVRREKANSVSEACDENSVPINIEGEIKK